MNYQRAGLQLSLVAAIDYTLANGEPSSRDSLHWMNPSADLDNFNPFKHALVNQYEKAIFRVGDVIAPYDSDQSFPVFGFGGEPKFMSVAEDDYCFPLNGSKDDPAI